MYTLIIQALVIVWILQIVFLIGGLAVHGAREIFLLNLVRYVKNAFFNKLK